MSELYADVEAMLQAHGFAGEEKSFENNGYSGARLSLLESAGQRYILKRIRFEDDWLMRLTNDRAVREAQFAASRFVERLPSGVKTPTIAVARDGEGRALLMLDVRETMLADSVHPTNEWMETVLRQVAEMHAAFWEDASLESAGIGWASVRDRINILTPTTGEMLVAEGRDFGLARGWRVFGEIAPKAAVRLVRSLQSDIEPLMAIDSRLPRTMLHGDLKLHNMGVGQDGTLWLIDWAMTMHAPVAWELSWLLTVNSSLLPWSLTETIERYLVMLEQALGAKKFNDARWDEQRDVVALTGLLSYGWGKALDAEAGRADELQWWCDQALNAAQRLGW